MAEVATPVMLPASPFLASRPGARGCLESPTARSAAPGPSPPEQQYGSGSREGSTAASISAALAASLLAGRNKQGGRLGRSMRRSSWHEERERKREKAKEEFVEKELDTDDERKRGKKKPDFEIGDSYPVHYSAGARRDKEKFEPFIPETEEQMSSYLPPGTEPLWPDDAVKPKLGRKEASEPSIGPSPRGRREIMREYAVVDELDFDDDWEDPEDEEFDEESEYEAGMTVWEPEAGDLAVPDEENKIAMWQAQQGLEPGERSVALRYDGGEIPLVGPKMMPEDILRQRYWAKSYGYEGFYKRWNPVTNEEEPYDDYSQSEDSWGWNSADKFRRENADLVSEHRDMRAFTDWDAYMEATPEDRQLISRFTVKSARTLARQRIAKEKARHRIGDEIEGIPGSANSAYVEVRPRPGPDEGASKKEAVNLVVARALGIPLKTASDLANLGSIWYYEQDYTSSWIRVQKDMFVEHDVILRVFPNPKRFKTCYVDDWKERIMHTDGDFVVVNKPPLLPCFPNVTNGRESLSQCIVEAIRVKKMGNETEARADDLRPCYEIDDECSGLVAVSRHNRSVEAFDGWLEQHKVTFEYVALVTGKCPEKRIYRHFYQKTTASVDQPAPALYEEIPRGLIKSRGDYHDWDIAEFQVIATAELAQPGAYALRLRTTRTGYGQRIRAQLAMIGAPVLNDRAATAPATPVSQEVADAAGLIPRQLEHHETQRTPRIVPEEAKAVAPSLLGGAVDPETLAGPYGAKLQLLPKAREQADRGVPQERRTPVPVGLHLARIDFMGRSVTCPPPAYWPEGAVAAVATQLTNQDLVYQCKKFMTSRGGFARFSMLGGKFQVRKTWIMQNFAHDISKAVAFASAEAKKEFDSAERVRNGDKVWNMPKYTEKHAARKAMSFRIREKFVKPQDWRKRTPTFKQVKKSVFKPIQT